MSLFGNGYVFLVVAGKSITLFTGKGSDEFVFPSEVVNNQEIINESDLEKGLDSFFKKYKKHTAVIVLGDEVLYYKNIVSKNSLADVKGESENFFQKTPFSSHFVAKKIIPLKDSVLCIATNLQIFGIVHEIAEKHGWKIPFILPINVFISEPTNVSYSALKKILSHKTLVELSNFLNVNKFEQSLLAISSPVTKEDQKAEEPEEDKTVIEVPKKYNYFLLFFIPFLITVIAASLVWYFLFFNTNFKTEKQTEKSISENAFVALSPTQTPTPKVTEIQSVPVSELKVNVLNGSGVAGQASEVKKILENKGFVSVETGNADEVNEATEVVFNQRVTSQIQRIVTDILEDLFNNVDDKQATDTGLFDIYITTGTDIIEL